MGSEMCIRDSTRVAATVTSNGQNVSDGFSWSLPNVDLTNAGSYRIRLWARDNAGNTARLGDNPTIDFDVLSAPVPDTQIPEAEVDFPISDLTPPAVVTIQGSAFDDISGVARVEVRVERRDTNPIQYWDGSAWINTPVRVAATVTSNGQNVSDGFSWSLTNVDLTNAGSYRIRLWARDNAGNTARLGDNPTIDFDVF